ncbi:flagellar hook protein FlgE [Anaerosolibacter sp.]|uniref:flagellar hook protein FlgE n=1 Tax=Anaerosolibacter sp. TaxID=1872527 RepID=UPI0039F14B7E
MMRSMFSAVSGLSSHQAKMDVIGNNIANVNTVGYKAGRVTFQEVFSQTIKGASAAQGGRGGTNPHQIGLGISVASIDTIHTRGSVERTDVPTDVMINGDGFFMVSNDPNFLNRSYTRAGNFYVDAAGNLNTAEGYRVLGYRVDESSYGENPIFKSSLEGLVINRAASVPAQSTALISVEGNLNSETILTAKPLIGSNPTDDAVYVLQNGKYEVNPQYTDSVAREYTFEVYDNLGGVHKVKQAYVKTGYDAGTNQTTFSVATFFMRADGTMTLATGTAGDPISIDPNPTRVVFNSDGELVTTPAPAISKATISLNNTVTNGAGGLTFDVNFEKLQMFANESTASATGDGYKQGTLDGFSIGPDGTIEGIFSNGLKSPLGRIALANFKNPAGLLKTQANMFVNTANSGTPIIGKPGDSGFASLNPGALEMSNVDLSKEFTTMITTQRGFQANSRVITTTDQMLEELVNLKR